MSIKYLLPVFLLLPLRGMGQSPASDTALVNRFTTYNRTHLQERFFLHTDKNFYLAGEIVWFKVYGVSAGDHLPLTQQTIVHVELIGPALETVLQANVEMDSGSAAGDLLLPASLPGGQYHIRAYSNWMRNEGPDHVFSGDLTIVNTLRTVSKSSGAPARHFAIHFFPEGGDLVGGLPSVVAFTFVTANGHALAGSGILLNQQNDTLLHFATTRFGMGRFRFVPKNGETYHAVCSAADTTLRNVPLPAVQAGGYTLELTRQSGQLQLRVKSTVTGTSPEVYLFGWQGEKMTFAKRRYLENGEALYAIAEDELPAGVNHFTVFNADRRPVAERAWFRAGLSTLALRVQAAETATTPRKKQTLRVQTTTPEGKAEPADLSLAVFQLDALQPVPPERVTAWLLLQSDLQGKIDSAEYYLDNPDAETADNLMLTHGWTRYPWQSTPGRETATPPRFLPESGYFILQGTLMDKSGRPVPMSDVSLSIPGPQFSYREARTDPSGFFRIVIPPVYGNQEAIFHADSSFSPRFDDPPAPVGIPVTGGSSLFSPTELGFLQTRSVNVQAENSFRVTLRNQWKTTNRTDSFPFYGKAEKHYSLDDYTRFKTMEEVMREYVVEVRVRKSAGAFSYRVLNKQFNIFFEDDPLVLFDGYPVSEISRIMQVDPLRVQSVDIIPDRFYIGRQPVDGVVSYRSYNGDLAGMELNPADVVLRFEGLKRLREFYSPVYDSDSAVGSPLPDTRNLLHWAPALRTGSDGLGECSFYTSDLTGKFAVVCQGIGGDGLPGFSVTYFTVGTK